MGKMSTPDELCCYHSCIQYVTSVLYCNLGCGRTARQYLSGRLCGKMPDCCPRPVSAVLHVTSSRHVTYGVELLGCTVSNAICSKICRHVWLELKQYVTMSHALSISTAAMLPCLRKNPKSAFKSVVAEGHECVCNAGDHLLSPALD